MEEVNNPLNIPTNEIIQFIQNLDKIFNSSLNSVNYTYRFQLDKIVQSKPMLSIKIFLKHSIEFEFIKVKLSYCLNKFKFSMMELKIRSDKEILNLMDCLSEIEMILNKELIKND